VGDMFIALGVNPMKGEDVDPIWRDFFLKS